MALKPITDPQIIDYVNNTLRPALAVFSEAQKAALYAVQEFRKLDVPNADMVVEDGAVAQGFSEIRGFEIHDQVQLLEDILKPGTFLHDKIVLVQKQSLCPDQAKADLLAVVKVAPDPVPDPTVEIGA